MQLTWQARPSKTITLEFLFQGTEGHHGDTLFIRIEIRASDLGLATSAAGQRDEATLTRLLKLELDCTTPNVDAFRPSGTTEL